MRMLIVSLLVATLGWALATRQSTAGDAAPPAAAPATTLEVPVLGTFNEHVLAVVATYPTDGTHGYHWPKSGSWSGNARTLTYGGKTLLEGDAEGRCHCCGLTFEVFLQAWERWTKANRLPYRIREMTAAQVRRLKGQWFGSAEDRSTLHTALTANRLGVRLTDWSQAKGGDFVQLWRYSGSGHSVVFLDWVREGKDIVGIRYWSSQGSTNGIGERVERFGDPARTAKANGSAVKRDEFWLCRVGLPRDQALAAPATSE